MSPGTRSATGTVTGRPSRIAVALSDTIAKSASIARPARYSWTKPMMALATTTASTTSPSVPLPTPIATAAAAISTQTNGLWI